MASVLSKFFRGAAASGAQSMMDKIKNDVLAKREEKLRQYQMDDAAKAREYQVADRTADQEFTTAQNALTREEARMQNAQSMALQAGQQGIAAENLELNRQETAARINQISKEIENSNLEAAEKKTRQAELDRVAALYRDPNADAAEIERQLGALSIQTGTYKPSEAEIYQATTLYGDDEDSFGQQRKGTGILNRRTGVMTPATLASPASSTGIARPQTAEEYDALPSGTLFVDPEDGQTYTKP